MYCLVYYPAATLRYEAVLQSLLNNDHDNRLLVPIFLTFPSMEVASANNANVANNTVVTWQFHREVIAILKACAVKCRSKHAPPFTVELVNSIESM